MYEDYTRQSLPSKRYRELLGSAICVFNSNNSFVIENILSNDNTGDYDWHDLIDRTSGRLKKPIAETITKQSNTDISELFDEIVEMRNRIIHSYQVTSYANSDDEDGQILATKYKDNTQETITVDYLLNFIDKNQELSSKLYAFRGH